jgi:hypothetical protein
MKNRWRNLALAGLVPVAIVGLAIQLGLFEPRDLHTVVGQAPSAGVTSIRADADYKYDIRHKDGTAVFVAVGTQLKYRSRKTGLQRKTRVSCDKDIPVGVIDDDSHR